ncbi:Cysteine-rich/transmembrane domain A-like protein [Quillaja saponaria]|uniref:Cysteine-rich/transmembrane domain A-like protein n=1 Tax=Quillaja saponaria TaxID=32244 RepID=A0AAD7QI84_QUISA|nr:Cysteine-rich/transmembrane domain A-like protein [Quillaja saponaria]
MSNYINNEHQAPPVTAYPPPYPPPGQQTHVYVAPPPPVGYPTKDDDHVANFQSAHIDTKNRGEGFWKGCVAALCCCWLINQLSPDFYLKK